MFTRFNGNVVPFADDSTSTNRTVFGGTTQSDLIDDNLNADFKKGWEIVGLNDNPTREDFNAMGYTLGALTAYLYEMGISEWNASQNYRLNSRVIGSDGNLYKSLTGTSGTPNAGNNPLSDVVNWKSLEAVSLTENQTVAGIKTFSSFPITPSSAPTTNYQVANKKYVDDSSTKYLTYGLGTLAVTNNTFDSFLSSGFYKQTTGGDTPVSYSTIMKLKHADDADADILFVHTNLDVVIKARTSAGGIRNNWVTLLHSGNNQQIGVDQTWQVVTASRALGITYTNSTGKPIVITATISGNGAGTTIIKGLVNGVEITRSWASYATSGNATGAMVTFIVPTGGTYLVNFVPGGPTQTLYSWSELR